MSQLGQINATGTSSTTYTFYLYPLDTKFQAKGGVYIILRDNTALYIGQSDDLSSRFDFHHKANCWRSRQANRMAAVAEADPDKRLEIEADLIDSYDPECNG